MLNKNEILQFKKSGFSLAKTFTQSKGDKTQLKELYSVYYNNSLILYIRKNRLKTFEVYELLEYAISRGASHSCNNTLEKVFQKLDNIVQNFNLRGDDH